MAQFFGDDGPLGEGKVLRSGFTSSGVGWDTLVDIVGPE
jgi:hypothetical protein